MDIERNIKRMYNYKAGAGAGTQFMDSCDTAIEALLELQKVIKENCNLQNVSQQRELLYGFITWYNAKPKVQKGEHVYTTDVDEFLKP